MASKALVVAAVLLTFFGLWFALKSRDSAMIEPGPSLSFPADDESALLVDVDPRADVGLHEPASSAAEALAPGLRPSPMAGTAASMDASDSLVTTLSGQVIDERTGEPVPYLRLTIQSLEDPIKDTHSTPLTRSGDGQEILRARTDAQGRFSIEAPEPPGGAESVGLFIVRVQDQPGMYSTGGPQLQVELPATAPLEVAVGPTFYLTSAAPPGCGWEALAVQWVSARNRGSFTHRTQVRVDGTPWIRFAPEIAELTGDGPWELEFSDGPGLTMACAQVDRHVGVEPEPLDLVFETYGAIDFVAPREPGAPVTIGAVHVTGPEPHVVHQAYLDPDMTGVQATQARARLGQLRPGTYRWTRGDVSGDVSVVAGEVVTVTLQDAGTGDTFDAVVRIDATAAPESDLSQLMFRIRHDADPLRGFAQHPVRVDSAEAGMWELRLQGLPVAEWNVVAPVGFTELQYEPQRVQVTVDREAEAIVARPKAEPVSVLLDVVDRETGAAIASAEAAVDSGGLTYSLHRAGDDGTIRLNRSPPDRMSEALIRAPGYRMAGLWFTPNVDGNRFTVALERGWGSVVRVVRTADLEPMEGIEIILDGTPRGTTDTRGQVWITGDEPPRTGELGPGSEGLVITRAPFKPDAELPPDPIVGFTFLVRSAASVDEGTDR